MEKQQYKIYKITNNINGKIYIGQTKRTLKQRFISHVSCAKHRCKTYLHNAIRKHGRDKFSIELVELAENLEKANELEIKWIAELKTTDTKIGYNLTTGGDGNPGHKMSEETRLKRKLKMTGRFVSDETRKKISLKNTGKKRSEESKEKMRKSKDNDAFRAKMKLIKRQPTSAETKLKQRLAKLGRHHSDETKRKISNIVKGRIVSLESRKKQSESRKLKPNKEQLKTTFEKHIISLGLTNALIATSKELGYCADSVKKYLQEYDIYHGFTKIIKPEIVHDFFSIEKESQEQYFWIGYIFWNFVLKKNSLFEMESNNFKEIDFFKRSKISNSNHREVACRNGKTYRISFQSEQIQKDLEKILEFTKNHLISEKIKNHKYIKYFMAGLLVDRLIKNNDRTEIYGNENFVNDVINILNKDNIYINSNVKNRKNNNCRFATGKQNIINALYDVLNELFPDINFGKPAFVKHDLFITKDKFIEVAKKSKTRKEMASVFECTSSNISRIQRIYGIKDEITKILKQNNI